MKKPPYTVLYAWAVLCALMAAVNYWIIHTGRGEVVNYVAVILNTAAMLYILYAIRGYRKIDALQKKAYENAKEER